MPETFSTTDVSQTGYFRIGFVELRIPPTDINTNRVINDDQVSTLRTSNTMFVKTGQARWDVTIHWKAIRFVNQDGTYDYSQWVDLQNIVAIFKASPFVEVENDFLRQHFTNVQQAYKVQRMAFALKQLRIDTNPDSNNVLNVVLTMSLFNFAPYTVDFSYIGASGDASNSPAYKNFIADWISKNITNHPADHSSPPMQFWQDQDEGVVTFKWRQYISVPINSPQPPVQANVSSGYSTVSPPSSISKKMKAGKLSNDIQTIVNNSAAKYGLDPKIVTALCLQESGGDPNAGRGRTDHGGLGLFQLVASTAAGLGVTDVWDPVQNADGGCRYLARQLATFGNYTHALGAYNAGPAYIYAYRDGVTKGHGKINPQRIKTPSGLPPPGIPTGENTPTYVSKILTNADRSDLIVTTPIKSTSGKPPVTPTTVTLADTPTHDFIKIVNESLGSLPPGLWLLDHYTEQAIFFYQEHSFTLTNTDSPTDGDYDMFPNQVSVVMVNNLPQIPLAAMQYPTYQHVGPADTMISINFNSVGTEDTSITEPEHGGIEALTAMSSQLEEQFHALRTQFRAVSSIQRMQSVYVENQLLNLLGIHGTLIRGINTETVPDAANLAQVNVLGSQYENIFEDTNPFAMNGIPKAYSTILKDILTSGKLNGLSKDEQSSISSVQEFSKAWAAKDPVFLLQKIFDISSNSDLDYLSSVFTPDAGLRSDQKAQLLSSLDLQPSGIIQTTKSIASSAFSGVFTLQKDIYKGLQTRRSILQKSSAPITFADYFVFSQLPVVADSTSINALRASTETKFKSQEPSIYDAMYSALFDFEVLTNPVFSRQSSSITNSPTFKSQFENAITVQGPATQKTTNGAYINPGHSCYRDLGLLDYKMDPANYFTDWNAKINSNTNDEITKVLGTANQTANDTNQPQSVLSTKQTDTQHTGDGFTFSANGQLLPGSANALIRQINIPAYSMNSAYPTFKLLLLEEDNTGPFFAFDNFYSYSSVMDIEVIKYQDKPDTAVIQITNLAHMLQHRLYDDTASGKMEKLADKFNVDPNSGLVTLPDGSIEAGTGGNPNAGITASKTASGAPYQIYPRKNMTEGRNEAWARVPLKYYALQTGSKIQVRMGYSNNPDELFPVFTGQVTSIEGDEILILTCQSFMLELMNIPGTLVKKDSYLGMNFLSGGSAFGGFSLTNSGDTVNILRTMLKAPTARHFGYWQINSNPDKLLKGFEWLPLVGSAMSNASNATIQKLGGLLQTGYDRSGENILLNSVVNFDASKTEQSKENAGSRTFDTENPHPFLGTTQYNIPKQSTFSVWEILKDVSRRYPHYNLMVKDYGFPYGADATLVYSHPLDWYYSRPKLLGDAEREKPNDASQGVLFQKWWSSTGAASWKHIFNVALPGVLHSISLNPITNIQRTNATLVLSELAALEQSLTELAGSGPEGFNDAVQTMHSILTGTFDINDGHSFIEKAGLTLYNIFASFASSGNLTGGLISGIDESIQALDREWLAFLQLSDPAANSSRIRPSRKYHLIDYNHIIHNGITVDDNIYNAVKIKDKTALKFNQNIPDHHIRCLDVTALINDPDHNVYQGDDRLANAYAQSFLREEVGKMYRGELIIRGVPDIEPFDIVLLNDLSTGMVGPIEVDTVIHSFNLENGYITIIKPKCMLIANESVSLGIIQNLGFAWANASANLHGLGQILNPKNPNSTISAFALTAGIGAGIVVAAVFAAAWVPPAAIILGSLALLAGIGILMYSSAQSRLNFFQMMPLSRFGRPWIGGLQGFAISDFAYSLGQSFKWFDADEIQPTIESWNELMNFKGDYLIQQ
jgi:hypothetical protein